ncbi:MAG: penicillin-binding protein 2, partial [Lentisphaeria bacterium]|nr:penicillin-binding protein 2 [Lentisphaeria bacterium]
MEFRFRSAVLLTFFVLWAVIAAFTLYRRTVAEGERLSERSESFARKEGVLPAARGTILDANGVPL